MSESRIADIPWAGVAKRVPLCGEDTALTFHNAGETGLAVFGDTWQQDVITVGHDLAAQITVSLQDSVRLSALEKAVLLLQQQFQELLLQAPICVPVQTFAPEPYDIMKPFQAVVRRSEDEYIASFFDANLSSSGSTPEEAVENLKDVITAVFESLSAHKGDRLGPGPKKQLQVLKRFLRRTDEGGNGDNHERARASDSQEA